MKKRILAMLMCMVLMIGIMPVSALATDGNVFSDNDDIAVFWYDYNDAYLSEVRTALNDELEAAGFGYTNYDSKGDQALQNAQIEQAINWGAKLLVVNIVELAEDAAQAIVDKAAAAEIPVIFFNREVSNDVINSYENACFVGTRPAEAGGMQGKIAGDYIVNNYDAIDLNGDGEISYIMMKGQLGNPEAEMRTRYAVEFCNNALIAAGKPELKYYDANNSDRFQTTDWMKDQAFNQMTTAIFTNPMDSDEPIEVVFANNDDAAMGCIMALNNADWNTGEGKSIPVFGIDCIEEAMDAMEAGKMTGSVVMAVEGIAEAIISLIDNVANGDNVFANAYDNFNVDDNGVAKIRVPYEMVLEGEVYESDYDYDYDYDEDGWFDDFEGASGECGDNLTWTLDENYVLTISGEGEMYDYYDEYPTWNGWYIESVVIEEGVTSIGDYAFEDNWDISSVTMADSVTSIGQYAFAWCGNLTNIEISEGVTSIGYCAFRECESLTSVTIPASVIEIDLYAFQDCSSLEEIIVDEDNEYFSNDESGVLFNKDKSVLIQAPISGINGSYIVPDGVTGIELDAFYRCYALTAVTIPESVTYIRTNAFAWCENLTSIRIPANVTWIEDNVFLGCYSLEEINVDKDNENYSSDARGVLFNKDKTELLEAPISGMVGSYSIPDGVEYVGYGAFAYCDYLTEVTIPASATYIDNYAFSNCYNLEKLIVNKDNKNYSSDARGVLFNKNKTELLRAPAGISGSYVVPDGVTRIGYDAFAHCKNLNEIMISASVNTIENYVFEYCDSLTDITVAENNQNYSSENGALLNKDESELIYVPSGLTGAYTIPASVKYVLESAFSYSNLNALIFEGDLPYFEDESILWNISTVYYPQGNDTWTEEVMENYDYLTWISYDPENPDFDIKGECGENLTWSLSIDGVLTISGEGAMYDFDNYTEDESPWFKYNSLINSVVIEEGVTTIGDWAFEDCYAVETISISNTVTYIGEGAISWLGNLTEVNIPASVTVIDINNFRNCENMTGIWVDENNPNYSSDGEGVLFNKDKTELVKVPGGFEGHYTVPETVATIGRDGFNNCMYLTGVTIHNNITLIKDFAFNECYNLSAIIVNEDNEYYASEDGVLFDKDKSVLFCIPGGRREMVTIPDSVTNIRWAALLDVYFLEGIKFEGDAPNVEEPIGTPITIYYPENNPTWTDEAIESYGYFVTWVAYSPRSQGDVNGDGKITNADLVRLARYLVEWYEDDVAADIRNYGDVNGDGKVTNSDLVRLARVLVGA